MKLRQIGIILSLWCVGLTASAQQYILQQLINKQPFNTQISTMTDVEKKESGVMLQNKILIEYDFDSTGRLACFEAVVKRVHINENKAVEMFNKITLPVPNPSDLLYLKARSISAAGVVKEVGLESVKDIDEQGRTFKILAVEGLEVGGELEYMALYRKNSAVFGSELLQSEVPIRQTDFRLISPSYLQFETKIYNNPAVAQLDTAAGIRILSMSINAIPAVVEEKYANLRANLVRADYKLSYNISRSEQRLYTWQDAAETFYDYLTNGEEDSQKAIAAFVVKQKIKGLLPEVAIRSLENYIKTNITVKDDAETESAAQVLKNQYASEAGVIRLYASVLRALKIPFEIVVGNDRTKVAIDKDFECWSGLDKYLLYFPQTKKYLDPANVFCRYGLIDQNLEGNNALFIQSKKVANDLNEVTGEVRFIPFSTPATNHDDMMATMEFSPTFDQIKGKIERNMAGQMATLRLYYYITKAEEDRKKLTDFYLKQLLKPDAVYSNVTFKNINVTTTEGEKPFIISSDVVLKSIIERAGKKYLFKIGELIGPQVEMYNEGPRQYPIDMGNAHSYHRVLNIKIPAGYKISGGLETIARSITDGQASPQMGFVSNYKLEKDVLTLTVDEFYKQTQLPVSVYDNFQKVINAAADFNKVTLVLEKL
jgi:hypothetical protein